MDSKPTRASLSGLLSLCRGDALWKPEPVEIGSAAPPDVVPLKVGEGPRVVVRKATHFASPHFLPVIGAAGPTRGL